MDADRRLEEQREHRAGEHEGDARALAGRSRRSRAAPAGPSSRSSPPSSAASKWCRNSDAVTTSKLAVAEGQPPHVGRHAAHARRRLAQVERLHVHAHGQERPPRGRDVQVGRHVARAAAHVEQAPAAAAGAAPRRAAGRRRPESQRFTRRRSARLLRTSLAGSAASSSSGSVERARRSGHLGAGSSSGLTRTRRAPARRRSPGRRRRAGPSEPAAGCARAQHLVEHEQHRDRAHVAVLGEDGLGRRQVAAGRAPAARPSPRSRAGRRGAG